MLLAAPLHPFPALYHRWSLGSRAQRFLVYSAAVKSRFRSGLLNLNSDPDPESYQYIPETAASALAGGCGGFGWVAPHHGGSCSSLAQGDLGRAVLEDA